MGTMQKALKLAFSFPQKFLKGSLAFKGNLLFVSTSE